MGSGLGEMFDRPPPPTPTHPHITPPHIPEGKIFSVDIQGLARYLRSETDCDKQNKQNLENKRNIKYIVQKVKNWRGKK